MLVSVARYNPQHSLRLAVGLQGAGLLAQYYTGLYASWQTPPFSSMRWLPDSLRGLVETHLFAKVQRRHPALDPSRVKVIGYCPNIILAALARAGLREPWDWRVFRRQFIRFERAVARSAGESSDVLVLYDTNAYHALEATKQARIVRVLDLASTHWATRDQIYRQEIEKFPEYSRQLLLPSRNQARFAELVAEPGMADYVVVGSEWAKATCVDNSCVPDRVFVVYYGVDVDLFHPPEVQRGQAEPFRILFVGGASPAKGFHYLLELLGHIDDPGVEFWCCGMQDGALGMTGSADASAGIRWFGHRPQADLARMMRQVDMLYHPSILDSFSLTCLEAMASGLPVLTTPRTGVSELITNGVDGFVAPYGDIPEMAGIVKELKADPAARRAIGSSARLTAQQYTWAAYESRVAEVFSTISKREGLV